MIRKNTSAREVRRQKHFVKCITVMDSQVDLLRFIRFRKDIIRKVNGKFKNCGSVYGYGVQLKNKCFTSTGYYLVNANSFRIIGKYDLEKFLTISNTCFDKNEKEILIDIYNDKRAKIKL